MSKKPKFICLGHSIVYGYPHRKSDCFVSLLRNALPDYEVINKGENGDTAVGMQRRLRQDVLDKHPYAMLLFTGTNDFVLQNASIDRVMDIISDITDQALMARIKVVLITPIVCNAEQALKCWQPSDYDAANKKLVILAEKIKALAEEKNQKIKEIAARKKKKNTSDFDHTVLKDDYCVAADLQSVYSEFNEFVDGIHPTAEGHKIIAECILKTIQNQ